MPGGRVTGCPYRAMMGIMTISHATDLFLGELERAGTAETTVDTYRRLLDKLADEHARHVDVTDLTVVHLRGFLDRQSKRRDGRRKSPATIAQQVTIVNGFFDWLTREGIVDRNPTRRNGERVLSRPRLVAPHENDKVTTISGDDVRLLLAEANRGTWSERLAVGCLVYLGPRRRAVAQLRISDYDPVGRRLTFLEKGDKTIEKPVPHALARLIESAIAAGVYDSLDDYLVPSLAEQRRNGDRDDRVIWRLVKDVAARAGVTTHVHALRAAFAVQYLETGAGDLDSLQQLMGHAQITTTQVYLRRLNRRQRMETVRELSWGIEDAEAPNGFPQIAEKPFEALPLAEKEGFEPSFDANPHAERGGTHHGVPAPVQKRLDELRARSKRGTGAVSR